jgi:predicted alpha-1,2-mannosidase
MKGRLKSLLIACLLGISVLFRLQAQVKEPVDYVDPFIGTDFFGHTFPGPAFPFGMIHPGPDVNDQDWTYAAGYLYSESSIMGFSHTHWSGTGMVNGGDILIMPQVSLKLKTMPGSLAKPEGGYRSGFDHADEMASPGYYSVLLKDYNVRAELTCTKRAAIHRYTFPKSDNSRIILDLGHQLGSNSSQDLSELRIIDDNRIEGVKCNGMGKVWFVAVFSKRFDYYGTFDNEYETPESGGSIWPYKNGEKGKGIGAFLTFRTKENEQILIRLAISYVSLEGARKNLEAEIADWDFDRVKRNAHEAWQKELSRISIEGASEDQKTIFYTAVYHSILAQYISEDTDGKYIGGDKLVHTADGSDYYGSFSCWDTYRSQHPLLTILAPDHVNDFITSIVKKTHEYGWLPAQHFQNMFGEAMVGDHLIPVITDAYFKGYRDFDVKFLYEAMRTKALSVPQPPVPRTAGRSGLKYYMELGYTPVDKINESVPNTLELAYDDWCIAQIAKDLGKTADYELFMKRACNYRNLWDPSTQFMRPKKADGSWLEEIGSHEQEIVKDGDHAYYKYFDPLLVGRRPNRYYTESNAWQYIWSVQHDVQGIIDLFGGRDKFISKLDTFFEMSTDITPPKYVGVVGTIGQYVHGNQPSHHVAYLYDYAGQPWKTQQRVREVCTELYRTGPGGICGNEDMGSLSSWFVLSSMGFYPVTPGSQYYSIGSPLFGEVRISVGSGKTFVINAINNSEKNIYIQSAKLNGEVISRTWITQKEIMNGGKLVFEMGPAPNKKWGSAVSDAPPSMTKAR